MQNDGVPHQPAPKKCREVLLRIFSILYYMHLLVAFFAALALMILVPELRHRISMSLVLVCVYGFMLVWLSLLNIFLVVTQCLCRLSRGRGAQCGAIGWSPKLSLCSSPSFSSLTFCIRTFLAFFGSKYL